MSVFIRYCDLPSHLKSSTFGLTLNAEDETSEIEIPNACFKSDLSVRTKGDLNQLLGVMAFWGIHEFPASVLEFCSTSPSKWKDPIANGTSEVSALHHCLVTYFEACSSIQAAINSQREDLLRFWIASNPPTSKNGRNATTVAASGGHLDLLNQLIELQFPHALAAMLGAIKADHLECVQLLHALKCEWNEKCCDMAAKYGSLRCLTYLHEHGCPWKSSNICTSAALNGQLDCLRYTHERGCELTRGVTLTHHTDCLRYALEHNCPLHEDVHSHSPSLPVDRLLLLHEFDSPLPLTLKISKAMVEKEVPNLRYAMDLGCPYDDTLVERAAELDKLDNLVYLIEEQLLPMTAHVFSTALIKGHVECVKYLVDAGCPCEYSHSIFIGKHYTNEERILEGIQYAVEHGWPCNELLMHCVFINPMPKCQLYLTKMGYTCKTPRQALFSQYMPRGPNELSSSFKFAMPTGDFMSMYE